MKKRRGFSMSDSNIALVMNTRIEYTTATYFRDVFEALRIPYRVFDIKQQREIPDSFNVAFYVDDATHFYIYPHPKKLKILYIIDTHMGIEDDVKLFRFADVVFCAQRNAVEYIRRYVKHVAWIPLACDPLVHSGDGSGKKYDIAYIGGHGTVRRKEILDDLAKRYPGSFIGRAEKRMIGKIYGSSKIVVNVPINNDINMRFFEGLCSGALLVTGPISGNGFGEILQKHPKQFCVVYNSYDDLVDKIDYYLAHDDEREAIAAEGRKFAENNTYPHRWNEMSGEINHARITKRSVFPYHLINIIDKIGGFFRKDL